MIKFSFIPDDDKSNNYHTVIITKYGNDHSLDEVIELFREFVLGIGYHPDNVKDYLCTESLFNTPITLDDEETETDETYTCSPVHKQYGEDEKDYNDPEEKEKQ